MERFTPDGIVPTQTGVMVTEELKPFIEVRVIIADTSCPWYNVTEGVEVIEKSGIAEVVLVLVVDVGVTTVNVDEPESPIGLPVPVTVYEVGETLLTVKEPVKAPFEIEQDEALTGVPDSEQLESLVEKLVPETWTVVPTDADAGLSVRVGEVTTVK
jgi:hypothetical protein